MNWLHPFLYPFFILLRRAPVLPFSYGNKEEKDNKVFIILQKDIYSLDSKNMREESEVKLSEGKFSLSIRIQLL